MKKMTLLSTVFSLALIVSFNAEASLSTLNCGSTMGAGNELLLFVANQNLLQVRVLTNNGSHQRALLVNKLANQNIKGVTLFTIAGSSELLEVENVVLDGQDGHVRLAGDTFSCLN
jgi:hypothetical protein